MTRPYPKDDPLFRPLSAKTLPRSAFQTLTGKVLSPKMALMAARRTSRQGHKGAMRRSGGEG